MEGKDKVTLGTSILAAQRLRTVTLGMKVSSVRKGMCRDPLCTLPFWEQPPYGRLVKLESNNGPFTT